MTRFFLLLLVSSALPFFVHAQVGIGTNTPVPSAALEVRSTDKGVVFPRMTTTQRKAISNPATGLMVFDLDKNALYIFNGSEWQPLGVYSINELKGVEISAPYASNFGFGKAAGISGNYAAVSAYLYDTLASTDIGAVLIYHKQAEGWRLHQRILAPDTSSSDQFGACMDMSGDYLIVGAPNKSVLNTNKSGKAYVFKLNTSTGFFEIDGQLTHPSGLSTLTYFGFSVGITHRSPIPGGVTVVVGAPQQVVNGVNVGTASVFHRNGANNYVHVNTINGFQATEQFGHAVDIDSNLVLVGAPFYDTTFTSTATAFSNTGRVQLNRFNAGNFNTVDFRLVPAIDTSQSIGYSVKLNGDLFAIAPSSLSTDRPNAGIRIYLRTSPGFVSQIFSYLTNLADFEGPETSSRTMGYQLAFTPNRFIAGVPHQSFFSSSSISALNIRQYLLEFSRSSSSLTGLFRQVFPLNDVEKSTRYGSAVATDGFQVIATMMPQNPNENGTRGKVVFYTTD